MNSNYFLKFLCSLPVILLMLYFIPFVGICLILARYFTHTSKRYYSLPIIFIGLGILLIIPKVIDMILKLMSIQSLNIAYLNEVLHSELYIKLLEYSKFLITLGIIFLIISVAFQSITKRVMSYIKEYIYRKEIIDTEASIKNDMAIKIRQEKAKNTHVIICPNCGADNILTEAVGTCKYCRSKLEYKK